MPTPVRLGVIGCGNVSLNRHLPAIREIPELRVVAAADPTLEQLKRYGDAAGLDQSDRVADYRRLLDRVDVDAVVVATPPAYRPAIVLAALQAGKHVLNEKPVALTPADAWGMARAARAAGLRLGVMHNYYFIHEHAAIKQVLESGVIGRPYLVTLNMLGVEDLPGVDSYQPRWRHDPRTSGGGVLMDMLHAVYLVGWLMGQPALGVSAAVDRRLDSLEAVEDVALCRFEFEGGFGLVNVAWGAGPGGVEIMCAEGRLLLVYERFGTGPFAAPEQLHVYRGDERVPVEFDMVLSRGFAGLLRDFAASIAQERDPVATGEAGAATLEATLAAYASALLQRQVGLPLDPSDPVYVHGLAGLGQLRLAEHSRVSASGLFELTGSSAVDASDGSG
ncbi:MAG: Gfo/Idh/MocA family oxidoreductase [Chloroflexota bacterium]|nr:Gfo/Idh/MocA family oxidoreductase [Chloroflexota bacterium]